MGNVVSMLPFSNATLATTVALNVGVQLLGFSIAAPLQTEKFYDAFGALGFISTIGYSFLSSGLTNHSARATIATVTTLLWSARLGSFLLQRVLASKSGDKRFDKIKKNPPYFFFVWMMQAAWVGITAAPVVLLNCLEGESRSLTGYSPINGSQSIASGLGLTGWLGLGIWAAGFGFEVIADHQKSAFRERQKSAKKDEWIQEGLWAYSRHPNYFGECVLWLGQLLLCSGGLTNATRLQWATALFSPVFVTALITQVSGIPMLEKSADKKWGKDQAYQAYKRRTSIFVPWFKPAPDAKRA